MGSIEMNIELRLYEELNDFLPDTWQKHSFTATLLKTHHLIILLCDLPIM
jgi:hypothetical protein